MLFNLAKCMVLFLVCNLRKLYFISAPDINFSEMFLRKNGVWKLLWLSLDDAKGEKCGRKNFHDIVSQTPNTIQRNFE